MTTSCGRTQIRGFITRGKLKTDDGIRAGITALADAGRAINWITIRLKRIQKLTRGAGFFQIKGRDGGAVTAEYALGG